MSTERDADKLYHTAAEGKYRSSRLAYDTRQMLKEGYQILHVHAFHMHMMGYWDAVEAMAYPETSFAKSKLRL